MNALIAGGIVAVLLIVAAVLVLKYALSLLKAKVSLEQQLEAERQLRVQQGQLAQQNEAHQKELLSAMTQGAVTKLAVTAQSQMTENGAQFASLSKKAMSDLIEPLKAEMKEFAAEVKSVKEGNVKMGEQISQHLQTLQATAAVFGKEARGFTEAFVRGNKVQGNFGEDILESLYERAGLKRGVNFVSQEGEGGMIPDTIVFDAISQRALVIDSKASYTDYLTACNAQDEATRQAALKKHVASLKKHVKELSDKKYPEKMAPVREGYAYLPIVAMFVPNERVLDAALEVEPELMQDAYNRGVVLVTPLTLMGYFWMIKEGWKRHSLDKNAEKIAKLAEMLVTRLDSAFVQVEQMGKALETLTECHAKLNTLMTQADEARSIKDVTLRIGKLAEKKAGDVRSRALKEALGQEPELMLEKRNFERNM